MYVFFSVNFRLHHGEVQLALQKPNTFSSIKAFTFVTLPVFFTDPASITISALSEKHACVQEKDWRAHCGITFDKIECKDAFKNIYQWWAMHFTLRPLVVSYMNTPVP